MFQCRQDFRPDGMILFYLQKSFSVPPGDKFSPLCYKLLSSIYCSFNFLFFAKLLSVKLRSFSMNLCGESSLFFPGDFNSKVLCSSTNYYLLYTVLYYLLSFQLK